MALKSYPKRQLAPTDAYRLFRRRCSDTEFELRPILQRAYLVDGRIIWMDVETTYESQADWKRRTKR